MMMTKEQFQQVQVEFEAAKKEWGDFVIYDGIDPAYHASAYQKWCDAKVTFAAAQDVYEAELEAVESDKFLSTPEGGRS
jgi:hypothetical protein